MSREKCKSCICKLCVETHRRGGDNYVWLEVLGHGSVVDNWFQEPADGEEITPYDDHWWKVHCSVISHGEDLVESHVKAFVDRGTRFARMMFLFEDGTLLEADRYFYELEYEYHRKLDAC